MKYRYLLALAIAAATTTACSKNTTVDVKPEELFATVNGEKISTKESEEGLVLAPKFDADGLVTCVATDAGNGELLMVAHMNAEALRRTVETGEAWYFSRSRKALWRKGESSGHTQHVVEMRVDCDQDAIWIKVEQQGPGACHTGRRTCFYRVVPLKQTGAIALQFHDAGQTFNPADTYGKSG
jgi:phosphoribosyl-AMP cyclohydrolase